MSDVNMVESINRMDVKPDYTNGIVSSENAYIFKKSKRKY